MSLYEHGFDETSDQGTNGTNANYSDGFGDSSMNAGSTGNGNANNNWNQADQAGDQSSWQQSSDQSWQNTNSQSSDQTWQNTNTQNANQNAGENSYGYNNGNNGAPFGQYQSKAESKKARKMNRKARRAAARQARKNKPVKHPTGRKFGMAIALGLVFGVVASFTFGGTNYLTRRATGNTADTTATLTTNKGKIQSTSTSSATTVTDVSDIVSNVMPSIVQVTNISIQDYQNFFGMNQQKQVESAGSGIIISEDNDYLYIATNNHVVSNTQSLTITFNDNQAVSGEVQGTAESSDLAVIKVKLSDIPSSTRNNIKIATLGSSDDLTVGESAIVIGNALGYGQSVTTGVISALNREVSLQDESGNTIKNKLIQTDAAVNPGNSGGAMLNMKGEVVGIVSAKYSDTEVEGMGYAIPISSASTIIDKLMKGESITDSASKSDTKNYGYSEKTATVTLGSEKNLQIYCMDITSDQSSQYQVPAGILVSQIIKDGAADKAGMEAGDIITKIGDKSVSTTQELKNILSEKKAGEKVEITYLRKADSTSSGNSGNSGNSGSSGNSNSRGNSFFDFFGY
ncbi:MAG: trypsin-like peptidase domain-containing protein [Lachnospiraceae bacterium]|nr:trypsin-like peptidase domain-containing protein [Lachnospiraceae bacterium]MDD6578182.1 trypsin-like peptidase domain-containing protein [Lachnospiraceae bacterium]